MGRKGDGEYNVSVCDEGAVWFDLYRGEEGWELTNELMVFCKFFFLICVYYRKTIFTVFKLPLSCLGAANTVRPALCNLYVCV